MVVNPDYRVKVTASNPTSRLTHAYLERGEVAAMFLLLRDGEAMSPSIWSSTLAWWRLGVEGVADTPRTEASSDPDRGCSQKNPVRFDVLSKLRGRTRGKNAARQFPTVTQWFSMSCAWCTFDGNQAAGLWTFAWEVETGYRSSDIRRVSDETWFRSCLGRHLWKKFRHENVPLKHYTFPRILKKIRGNIVRLHAAGNSDVSKCDVHTDCKILLPDFFFARTSVFRYSALFCLPVMCWFVDFMFLNLSV